MRKCFTSSSPPNARKAEVSMAAPSRMMKTSDVVFAVSIITPRSVSSMRNTRHPLQMREKMSRPTAASAALMPKASSALLIFLILVS